MSKNKYYLAVPDLNDFNEINDYKDPDGISYINNLSAKELKEENIQFCCDHPDGKFGSSYCDNVKHSEVLVFEKLLDLINFYLFPIERDENGNEIPYNEEENITPIEAVDNRLQNLLNNVLVLRRNKDNLFSVVDNFSIQNCFEQMKENLINDNYNAFDDIDDEALASFDEMFTKFTNKIESLVENGEGHFIISSGDLETFMFPIFKENSNIYKELKKEKENDLKIAPKHNDFIYGLEYDGFREYTLLCLLRNFAIGLAFSTNVTKGDESSDVKPIKKVYGFNILLNFDGSFEYFQLDSKELLDCYTVDAITREPLPPEKNTIYCGIEKDDIICGFDLL